MDIWNTKRGSRMGVFQLLIPFVGVLFAASAALAQVTIPTVSKEVGKEGGAFSVNTGGSGSWTATTSAGWIALNRASGNAGVSCIYTVNANFSTDAREGIILIGGNTFTVYQTGYDATISPTSTTVDYTGGGGTVSVTVDAGVLWTAKADADWISVTPSSGMSVGTVTYTVAANTDATTPRMGTITIAGKVFMVTQTGTDILISPMAKTLPSDVRTFQVEVIAQNDTSWTVTPDATWISVVDSGRGHGTDIIMVAVGANPSAKARTGTVSIGSKKVKITQIGTTDISLAITPTEAQASPVGAYGNVAVYVTPDATWTAKSDDSWIMLSDGASGAGNGNTKYVATANPTLSDRTGRICFEVDGATGSSRDDKAELDAGRIVYEPTTNFTGPRKSLSFTMPRLEQKDWSFSFSFCLPDSISNNLNRLLQCFDASIYVDEDNILCWDGQKTDYKVAFGLETNNFVFCHDANGYARVYAGINNKVELVGYFKQAWLCQFTSASNACDFSFGYATKPSSGYLSQGKFGNCQVWGRSLTESEVEQAASCQLGMEDVPTILSGCSYAHFRCNMNGLFTFAINGKYKGYGTGVSKISGWSTEPLYCQECPGRNGARQRAMRCYDHMLILGPGHPYFSSSNDFWRSWNFWLCFEDFDRDFSLHWENITVNLGQNGWNCRRYLGSGNYTNITSTFSGFSLQTNQWIMLTLVSVPSGITVYINGKEMGSGKVSESLHTCNTWEMYGWNGALDEITMVTNVLTSTQVKALYEETKPATNSVAIWDGKVYHTVTQGVIAPEVAPTNAVFSAGGGNGSTHVTVAANTQWAAESSTSWISLLGGTNHVGSADVTYIVAANPATEARTGTFTLAEKTVRVTQEGVWSQLTYDGTVFGETSGSGFIGIQVDGDATWTASSDSPWLTLLDTSGHGSAEIMFVVDDFNTTVASRTATLTIAGKTLEITQRGYKLSIDPAVADLASNAGAGEIGITAPIDAVWEAIVTADWITLIGGNMGVGSGTLRYTIADNPTGETRTGKIIISGQEYTVTQHANLTLTTKVDGSGTVAGAGDYETNEKVTLTATPDEGFAFTHWSGDAVGVEPVVTITMDMSKTVTAHFIPEDAAARLAEEKAAQGGFYTREQMKALAMGDTVIEVDPEDGRIDLAIQLQESADLSGGEWDGVEVGGESLAVDGDGVVHIKMAPKGNTAFYRLVKAPEE